MLERLIKWWKNWEFDPTESKESQTDEARFARVNCIHLYPGKVSAPGVHCDIDNLLEQDCHVYTGKVTDCHLRHLKVKPMSHSEILKRVVEKERVNRCVNNNICPYCGLDLKVTGDDDFLDKECFTCYRSWPYV